MQLESIDNPQSDERFVCIFTIAGFTSIFLNNSAFFATSQLALISSIL